MASRKTPGWELALQIVLFLGGVFLFAGILFNGGDFFDQFHWSHATQVGVGIAIGALPFPIIAVMIRTGHTYGSGRVLAYVTVVTCGFALAVIGSGIRSCSRYSGTCANNPNSIQYETPGVHTGDIWTFGTLLVLLALLGIWYQVRKHRTASPAA